MVESQMANNGGDGSGRVLVRVTQKEEKNSTKKVDIVDSKRKRPNYIVEDRIIREIIEKEVLSQIKFQKNWRFLLGDNLNLLLEEISQEYSLNQTFLKENCTYYRNGKFKNSANRLKPIPIPKCSSNFEGCISGDSYYTLELFGQLSASSLIHQNTVDRYHGIFLG